ncbi:hypothetical protein O1L60_00125 [Streptomyces diastatochromogenes]|nr:hypothetical protein [Streptomyces diastatochromogenes]
MELLAALNAEVTAVVAEAGQAAVAARCGAARVMTDLADVDGSYEIVYEAAEATSNAAGRGLTADGGTLYLYESFAARNVDIGFFRFFGGPEQAGLRHFVFRTATPEDRELAQLLDLMTTGELSLGCSPRAARRGLTHDAHGVRPPAAPPMALSAPRQDAGFLTGPSQWTSSAWSRSRSPPCPWAAMCPSGRTR